MASTPHLGLVHVVADSDSNPSIDGKEGESAQANLLLQSLPYLVISRVQPAPIDADSATCMRASAIHGRGIEEFQVVS